MKVHFVEKFSEGDTDAQLTAMRNAGFVFVPPGEAELIYVASIAKMQDAINVKEHFDLPLAVYCWDYYLWAHGKMTMSGDWVQYAKLLAEADVIFVPSSAQQLRLKELLGLDSYVVLTGVPTYEGEVSDGRYILDPLRYYPEENSHWAEMAAKELGIPIIHSEHGFSEEEFRSLVRNCSFLTSCVREASTGGLSLIEGLWHGKPSLVSNSPYMGARDYLGQHAVYFQHDSYEDLKLHMKDLWDSRISLDIPACREFISAHLSYKQMAERLYELCKKCI